MHSGHGPASLAVNFGLRILSEIQIYGLRRNDTTEERLGAVSEKSRIEASMVDFLQQQQTECHNHLPGISDRG